MGEKKRKKEKRRSDPRRFRFFLYSVKTDMTHALQLPSATGSATEREGGHLHRVGASAAVALLADDGRAEVLRVGEW